MRNRLFCICENKDADQLRGSRELDQRLCFRYTDCAITHYIHPKFHFCGSTDRFVSDLVGNAEDRFSHNEAHIIKNKIEELKKKQHTFCYLTYPVDKLLWPVDINIRVYHYIFLCTSREEKCPANSGY